MAWKVKTEFDDDNDGVGTVTCSYFDDDKSTEPSFVYSVRADTKIKKELNGVLRDAFNARRKKLAKAVKQNSVIAEAEDFINKLETGVTTSGNN